MATAANFLTQLPAFTLTLLNHQTTAVGEDLH